MKTTCSLLACAAAVSLALAVVAQAAPLSCCVCTACPAPVTAVCVQELPAPCASVCSSDGCQISTRVPGLCPATAAACEAQFSTARAPALTLRVAVGVALLLLSAGLYLVRRRRPARTLEYMPVEPGQVGGTT